MEDFRYLYYLTKASGLGPVRIRRLLDKYKDPKRIFGMSLSELRSVDGINNKIAGSVLSVRKNICEVEKEFLALEKKLERLKIGVLTYTDSDYPDILRKIYDPPIILYLKGKLSSDNISETLRNCVGIVGTRTPSEYGKRMAASFAVSLSSLGITIVSGFARGIDTISHNAVLTSTKTAGRTVAIFGNGVDVIYPPENRKIYSRIIEEGLVLSECEISSKPDSANFPRRNRIISGLSLGVLIIESGLEGGALITARTALDQSREVFAVPGNINSRYSEGTNELIKTGQAKLVSCVDDVLVEIQGKLENISVKKLDEERILRAKSVNLAGNEKKIFNSLIEGSEPLHIDTISESTGLNISDCLVTLLNLEFKGLIRQIPGKRFQTI